MIPYEPFGNQKEQRVGGIVVVGNSSMATACKGGMVRMAIKEFDNQDENNYETSAFDRALAWAKDNQDKGQDPNSLF